MGCQDVLPVISLLKAVCLGASVVLVVYVCWYLYTTTPFPTSDIAAPQSQKFYQIEKPILMVFDGDLLRVSMRADSVGLMSRRLFVFHANAIKKPIIKNASIDFHYYDASDDVPDLSFFETLQLPTADHKIALHSLTWNFYRDNKLVLLVKSKKAFVYLKQRQIHFFAAVIESSGSPKEAHLSQLVWDDSSHQFSGQHDNKTLTIHPNDLPL